MLLINTMFAGWHTCGSRFSNFVVIKCFFKLRTFLDCDKYCVFCSLQPTVFVVNIIQIKRGFLLKLHVLIS